MRHPVFITLLSVLILSPCLVPAGEISTTNQVTVVYHWYDETGVHHYSDTAPPDRASE